MKLLVASKNLDKVSEIRELLKDLDLEIMAASDIPELPDVVEDQDTIKGNAVKKAREMALAAKCYTLADDTGLFVDALNGTPGVYAARYAGESCSYLDNRLKMLREMKGQKMRSARFKTSVALVDDKGNLLHTTEGIVEGEITEKEIGDKGFGHDNIFFSIEAGKTFGEMQGKEKHAISHRGRAFRQMLPYIAELINKEK